MASKSESSFWPPGAYLVGGAVRDELLGIAPNGRQDRDFVVPKWRDTAADYMSRHMPDALLLTVKRKSNSVSARVRTADGEVLDLSFTAQSLAFDLLDRDFTVNSFAKDVLGNVTACHDGAKDNLRQRVLTTVDFASDTFAQDPARIIRAYRLRAQLTKATGHQWGFSSGLATELNSVETASKLASLDDDRLVNEIVKLAAVCTANEFFSLLGCVPSQLSEIMLSNVQSLKFAKAQT